MAVVTSVMRVQQIFLGRADAILRPFGLTFARYEVLMLLSFSRTGALPLGKIGERLQVNPASVTNAIDRLEDGGLVTRAPNPADGRGTLAHLTEHGRRLAADATDAMNGEMFATISLDPAELSAVWGLLAGLRRAAGDFDGGGGPAT
jgi:DNA-binding MarR family transcriptional regulator